MLRGKQNYPVQMITLVPRAHKIIVTKAHTYVLDTSVKIGHMLFVFNNLGIQRSVKRK